MTGYATFRDIGVYYTAEGSLLMLPKRWLADGTVRGVLFMHGATGNETQMVDNTNFPGLRSILAAVAMAGYPVLGVYAGGDTWGNATAQARMDDAKTYLQGTVGAKSGTVAIIGGSMGGLAAQNWAKANPASTACIVGLVPVSDLNDIKTANRGGLAASVNAAYGGTYVEATHGATYNPHTYAATGLAGIPYKAWYGASDAIVIPSTVTDVCTAAGASATAVSVVGGHDTALDNIPTADVVSFIGAHV